MSISPEDLKKIAALAYLDTDEHQTSRLIKEVSGIMDFVDQLRSIDTTEVVPLFHPLALNQRLRADVVTEADCLAQLKELAPLFEDNLYLVPPVIDVSK